MNKILFRIGALLTGYSLFFWLGFSSEGELGVTLKEVAVGVMLGGGLMLPEIYYRLCQFFLSGPRLDDWFADQVDE